MRQHTEVPISLKKTFQKLERQMPENRFLKHSLFQVWKESKQFVSEKDVLATRVSSQSISGMGGKAVQMSRKGTSLMAGSCFCSSQNYTFLSFCQKQRVILVTLYFPHCSFPCNYWMQLGIPCCIITQLSVPLKDMRINIMKVHGENPPSKESLGFLPTWQGVWIRWSKI